MPLTVLRALGGVRADHGHLPVAVGIGGQGDLGRAGVEAPVLAGDGAQLGVVGRGLLDGVAEGAVGGVVERDVAVGRAQLLRLPFIPIGVAVDEQAVGVGRGDRRRGGSGVPKDGDGAVTKTESLVYTGPNR